MTETRVEKTNKYRAIQFSLGLGNESSVREWLKYIWGFDIWFGNVPFCKTLLLAHLISWILVMVL